MSSSNTTKTWILTRSQTYEPGKSLCLGQVLLNPRQPADALFSKASSFLPIPAEYIRDFGERKNVTITIESKLNASFTAWGKLNGTPVTAKGHAETNKETTKKWILQKLESESFLPDLEYVREILNKGDVPDATKWWKLQRRIFLVTGVRIARGASVSATDSHKNSVGIKVGVDGITQSVPVQAGLGAAIGRQTEQTEKAEESSDFVFAYRLHEITWIAGVDKHVYTGGDVEAVHESHASVDQEVKDDADEITGYELESLELFDEEDDVDDMVE
ncbi:hypothetical protein CFAM422_003353 [Trichoderma lentiforme]|uniref:Uncharacterized protein n=1 Tax=Trichoderma lentiforme TaxID=1567552 RepID=A0A9P4XHZ5_9HYPO|nr:hypothetical protein CFAM422_003353 [Trichoderma lentiforme]